MREREKLLPVPLVPFFGSFFLHHTFQGAREFKICCITRMRLFLDSETKKD